MKIRFVTLILAGILALSLSGCGGSKQAEEAASEEPESGDSPISFEVEDALIEHEVLYMDGDDDYSEYWILFYGNDTRNIKALTSQDKFNKSAGYTIEMLEEFDLESVYPGITSMDFVDYWFEDQEDTVDLILRFQNMDNEENLEKMQECGVITLTNPEIGGPVSVDITIENLEENGSRKLEKNEYDDLGLCFELTM